LFGAVTAVGAHERCVEDMKRLGFMELSRVFWGVKKFSSWTNSPARVLEVIDGSPAAISGVKAGDVIVAMDGKAVATPKDVMQLIGTKQPGDRLQANISRDGKTLDIESVLRVR